MSRETLGGNVILGHDPFNDIIQETLAPRHNWDGNRLREGIDAQQWASAYASQQIDYPPNLIATDTARTTYRFVPYDAVTSAMLEPMLDDPWMSTGPWAGGNTGYPMRGSDDMRLLDEEVQTVQDWMMGAP